MVKKIKDGKWKKHMKEVQKDMKKKIGLFDRMGDECMTCEDPFDKTDVEMVRDWHVTVRGEAVNLYCPECWSKAREIIKGLRNRIEKRSDND